MRAFSSSLRSSRVGGLSGACTEHHVQGHPREGLLPCSYAPRVFAHHIPLWAGPREPLGGHQLPRMLRNSAGPPRFCSPSPAVPPPLSLLPPGPGFSATRLTHECVSHVALIQSASTERLLCVPFHNPQRTATLHCSPTYQVRSPQCAKPERTAEPQP